MGRLEGIQKDSRVAEDISAGQGQSLPKRLGTDWPLWRSGVPWEPGILEFDSEMRLGIPSNGGFDMTKRLEEVSDALAAAVEEAGAGVVRVEGRRRMPASGIVWSADGVIVTAHHVVRSEEGIEVGLPDGREVSAQFVGRDPGTDLAVLRLSEHGLKVLEWKDPREVKVGHLVLALGRPGKTVQASQGIVAAFGGEWQTFAGGKVEHFLQADIVMYPGFSGGPLIAADGTVSFV